MQEIREDNSEVITPNATDEQVRVAIGNPRNKTILLHKPGSILTDSRGTQYQVHEDGSLRRITQK